MVVGRGCLAAEPLVRDLARAPGRHGQVESVGQRPREARVVLVAVRDEQVGRPRVAEHSGQYVAMLVEPGPRVDHCAEWLAEDVGAGAMERHGGRIARRDPRQPRRDLLRRGVLEGMVTIEIHSSPRFSGMGSQRALNGL